MSATIAPDRVSIDRTAVDEARATITHVGEQEASIVLRFADGSEEAVPQNLQRVLLAALASLAGNGGVTIGQMPEDLTSTAAADALGVSRPTLMKWAKEEKLPSFKVGSHTRFKRDDVLDLRKQRDIERREAFAALRALDADSDEISDD